MSDCFILWVLSAFHDERTRPEVYFKPQRWIMMWKSEDQTLVLLIYTVQSPFLLSLLVVNLLVSFCLWSTCKKKRGQFRCGNQRWCFSLVLLWGFLALCACFSGLSKHRASPLLSFCTPRAYVFAHFKLKHGHPASPWQFCMQPSY